MFLSPTRKRISTIAKTLRNDYAIISGMVSSMCVGGRREMEEGLCSHKLPTTKKSFVWRECQECEEWVVTEAMNSRSTRTVPR